MCRASDLPCITRWERRVMSSESQRVSRKYLTSPFLHLPRTGGNKLRLGGKSPLSALPSPRRGGPCSVQARDHTPPQRRRHTLLDDLFSPFDGTPFANVERFNDAQGEQPQRIPRFYCWSCSRYAKAEPGLYLSPFPSPLPCVRSRCGSPECDSFPPPVPFLSCRRVTNVGSGSW